MDWSEIFSKILVGAASGLVVAFYTARYTINKFYTEKWWEKKFDNYSQLLSTLYSLKIIFENSLDDAWRTEHYYQFEEEKGGEEPEPKADWSNYEDLMIQLKKSLMMSPLLLSTETKPKIENFFKSKQEVDRDVFRSNYPRYLAYDDLLSSLNELIEKIINEAQSELNSKGNLGRYKENIQEHLKLLLSKIK